MSERISIAELRSWASVMCPVDPVDHRREFLLALVEAVEAAHFLLYGEPDIVDDELNRVRHQRLLADALARFEWEPDAP